MGIPGSTLPLTKHITLTTVTFSLLVAMVTARGCCSQNPKLPNHWRCIGVTSASTPQVDNYVQTLEIDCKDRSVVANLSNTDLVKKSQLRNLKITNCSLAHIFPHAFEKLNHLESIELQWNSLEKMNKDTFLIRNDPDTSVGKVTWLDLSNNDLREVPSSMFLYLRRLRKVILRANNIDDLDPDLFILTQLLIELDLGENLLTSLPASTFRLLMNVEILSLDYNLLEAVDGAVFPINSSLKVLRLSHNSIGQLSPICQRSKNLTELYLDNNKLLALHGNMFQGCSLIEIIDLHKNQITMVGDALDNMPSLSRLSLQGNSLIALNDKMFSALHSLQYLELQHNAIAELSGEPFNRLTSLEYLDLSGNKIETLDRGTFSGLSKLLFLDLAGNQITTVREGVFENSFVKDNSRLRIRNNVLSKIEPMAFSNVNLFEIDLSGSAGLIAIPVDAFGGSHVQSINVSGCSLGNVDFLGSLSTNRLQQLDLSRQKQELNLDVLQARGLDINWLFLNDNNFKSLEFLRKTQVYNLSLDRTNIKKLLPGFRMDKSSVYSQHIHQLSLRGNDIETIDEISVLFGPALLDLDISENQFTALEKSNNTTEIVLPRLLEFTMDDNRANQPVRISCDFFKTNVRSLRVYFVGSNVVGLEELSRVPSRISLFLGGTTGTVWDDVVCLNSSDPNQALSLHVTHAGLTAVPPIARGHPNCHWMKINLQYNQLTRIHQNDFGEHREGRLETLDLSHNNIYAIKRDALNIASLRTIDLSHNDLTSLDDLLAWLGTDDLSNWLQVTPLLQRERTIDVSHNDIQTVSEGLNSVLFTVVNVDYNPFHCNCEMSWVFDSICADLLADPPAGECSTPTSLAFSQMVPEDIPQKCQKPSILKVESYETADDNIVLTCKATGDPLPQVSWFKTEENKERVLLTTAEPPRDRTDSQCTIGSVVVTKGETQTIWYWCEAASANLTTSQNFTTHIQSSSYCIGTHYLYKVYQVFTYVFVIVAVIGIFCFLIFTKWRQSQKRKKPDIQSTSSNKYDKYKAIPKMEDAVAMERTPFKKTHSEDTQLSDIPPEHLDDVESEHVDG